MNVMFFWVTQNKRKQSIRLYFHFVNHLINFKTGFISVYYRLLTRVRGEKMLKVNKEVIKFKSAFHLSSFFFVTDMKFSKMKNHEWTMITCSTTQSRCTAIITGIIGEELHQKWMSEW